MAAADRSFPSRALAGGLAALALAAWLSAGLVPLRDTASEVGRPSDFATDYVPAARLVQGLPPGVDAEEGNADAARLGVPPYTAYGTPYRAHPPPSLLVVAALVPLGWPGAAWAWLAVGLVCVVITASIAASHAAPGSASARAAACVALALWPPTLHDLEKGQWSVPVAALLALAFHASQRGRSGPAAALAMLAGAFKIVPALAIAGLVPRDPLRRRALAIGALATLASIAVITLVAPGAGAWIDFARAAPENTRGWQTGLASTTSVWGLCARLFVGGPYATPLFESELLARVTWLAVLGALALALVRTAAAHADGPLRASPATFAAACTFLVLANPLGWTHTGTWLALPLAITGKNALDRRDEPGLALDGLALALLSIPRQALFALAGPAPLSPLASLALTPPLIGAVLTLLACLRALRAEATPSRAAG